MVELSRTRIRYQAKLLTLSPLIDSKKSYLGILGILILFE